MAEEGELLFVVVLLLLLFWTCTFPGTVFVIALYHFLIVWSLLCPSPPWLFSVRTCFSATDPICVIELLSEDDQPAYWCYFPVLENNSAGQGNVKLGEIALDCWLPPTSFPNPPGSAEPALKETKLQIVVYPVGKPPADLFGKDSKPAGEKKEDAETKKDDDTKKKEDVKTDDGNQPFIKVKHDAPSATPLFGAGDGFDLYIDGARFLPDNATIPKITARVFNHEFDFVDLSSKEKQETAICELTDNVFWYVIEFLVVV